jgi:hypothetical protein
MVATAAPVLLVIQYVWQLAAKVLQMVVYLDTVEILVQVTKVVLADAVALLRFLDHRDAVVAVAALAVTPAMAAPVVMVMQLELLQALLVVLLMHQVVAALVEAVDILTLALALAVAALEYTAEVIPVAQTLQEIQVLEVADPALHMAVVVQEQASRWLLVLVILLDLAVAAQYVSYGQVLRGIFPVHLLQTFDRPQTQLMHTCIKKITVSFG